MSEDLGKFVWYDVMTTDTKAAEAFYRSVVGWDAADLGIAGRSYTLFSIGGARVGGLMALPDAARAAGAQPRWNGYIAVDDVDAYAERVKAAGGAIHHAPMDIPGVGRFAVATDPDGTGFTLFRGNGEATSPGTSGTPVAPGTPGHVGWHDLVAGDLDAAWAFYSGLFGWTKAEAIDMGGMGIYQTFTAGAPGSPAIGGMMTRTADTRAPRWLYFFNVPAIDAAASRVTQGGGQIVSGPMQVPGGLWIVTCTDPQGATFAMVGPER